ncbi:ABC transporter ATP-binding protein [Pseudogemmobacter bohemicus]|uniref:ABC transporter ATP-binding protein n=1 Tax=Pseudogemmobacter bohemicus TaxID=2250708 RepID=UPI000DD370CA|nr:ABC transporter ATP-binding protein [Pseudogemmobacter bohemicus]
MSDVNLTGIAKSYGGSPVLTDISVSFPSGSFTSLLGPSGSGKTTLLRIIAGFITPEAGAVTIGAEDVTRVPVWARNIGMVFQSYALFPHMTVRDNVAFGLGRRGVKGAEAKRRVDEALEMVRLPGFADRLPKQLSGGQQQRVAMARAIVTEPKVLLLDEPLSALDRRLRQEMQVELLSLQREIGVTTIFVTHDQEEALTLSDQVAILDRGRIVQMGAPAAIYERPATRFAAEFLGDANFFTGRVESGAVAVAGSRITAPDLPEGREVTLAVRPEKISLGAGENGGNRVQARVLNAIYAGANLTYLMEGPGGMGLKVFAQNADGVILPKGAEVTLHWSPDHTILVED